MAMKSKLWLFVFLACLIFPYVPTAAFVDVPAGYWAGSEIDRLAGLGALYGYPDGMFRPEAGLNRAELAAILDRLKKLPVTQVKIKPFPDVRPQFWAAGYIAAAAKAGLVLGYPDGTFRPTVPLDRVDAIVTVMRLEELSEPYDWKVVYRDVTSEHWAVRYVYLAKKNGFLDYIAGNDLEPAQVFTRAELCWMLARTKLVKTKKP